MQKDFSTFFQHFILFSQVGSNSHGADSLKFDSDSDKIFLILVLNIYGKGSKI